MFSVGSFFMSGEVKDAHETRDGGVSVAALPLNQLNSKIEMNQEFLHKQKFLLGS